MDEILDPLVVVVSREEVEAGDIEPALDFLSRLHETPAIAHGYQKRVDISFAGYDEDTRELFEIDAVRDYVLALDERFPFWLFLLSKRYLDLQCLLYSTLPPFPTTVDGASVHPRVAVQRALALNAVAVIFVHNHPSGIAEPSQADLRITQRLKDSLALVEVWVLDHIIVGVEDTVSFAERSLL